MGGAFAEEGTSFDSDLTDENTTTELPEESSANSPLQLAYNDPELRAAHAYVESRGNPNAVSEKGAEGMFQFIPETWKQYGPKGKSPRDPVASAAARDNYYKDLLEMYDGDTELALAAYHAGPGNVDKWIKEYGTKKWSELKEKIKDKNPRSAEYPGLVLDAYQKKKGSAPFSPEGEEPEGERSFYQLGNAASFRPSKLEIAREYTDSIEAVRSAYKNWDLGKTPGSIQDFSKMMLPIVNSGSYSDLSQVEKLNLLSKAYNNDTWDDSVASFVQDRASEIIKGMTSAERPEIESLVYEIAGPAPQFGTGSADETKAAIRDWKSTVYKRFNEAHVRPELFGDLLPEYFKKVEESEDDAAAIRNRSALAWAFNKTGNMAVSTAKGVVEANITSPLAMLSRAAVYPFSAEASESVGDWIAALPEIMGKPSTDYLYETTPDGHFKLVNGMPILKKTDEYLRMAGSILGYLVPAKWLGAKAAEAAFVKAATGSSSSFAKLVKYGIGGDLTLSMMEGAYKKSEAAGGTVKENMLSAFATMPVSAAASFGLLNVASGAMPRLTELNAITRNRMIFSHIAKHAVDSGAVMGLQVAAQAGVIGQVLDKDVYNKEEIINAALIAGAVGGLVKATEVPGILKADARITADMQKNKLFREEQSKAEAERLFQLRNASPEERKIVEDALLKFQTSPAAALNLTKKQAALVLYNPYYKNLLANISAEVTPIPEGGVTITRKTTYVPKTEAATDLKELDKLIADLERQTGKNAIGPESLQKAIARKDQLEAKLNSEINYQDEKWKTWANQHTKLQQALNKAEADAQEAYKYRRTDRDRWREAKQAVDEAKKELSKFNKDNEVFTSRYWKSTSKLSDEFSRSVSDIVSEYKALEGKVTTAVQDDLYINNQVAMQNHLAELYKMRPAFVAQMFKELKANKAAEAEQEQILTTEAKDAELNKKLAAEEQIDADRVAELAERGELFKRLGLKRAPESASFEEGMVIEGKKVIRGSNGKWYVFNELNEQISKGYELRADAVEALENNFKELPASEQGTSGPTPTRTGVSGEATDEGLARAREEGYALGPEAGVSMSLRTEKEAEAWAKDSSYSVTAFHGTPDNRFTEFSNEFLGRNTGAEGAKLGHFAVNDYRDATVYTKSFGKNKEAASPGVLKVRLKANNPITVDLAKENHGSITAKFVNDLKAKGHDLIEFIWSYQKVNPKKYYMWFDPEQATIITESKDTYRETSYSLGAEEGVYKRTIQPDPAYETLRPVDKPRYPLSSKYTKLENFDRTGTKPVRAPDVMQMFMNAARGFEHNLKLIVGGMMPKAVKLRDGVTAKVHGYVNLMRGIWKVGRPDDVAAAHHEFIHLVTVEALQGKGTLNSLVGDFSSLPDKVRYAALRMGIDFTPNAERLPEVEQIKEGLAKFWEHYVSKQPVHQDLLDWYHGEFKASNPKMYKMLEKVKDKMFEYYNQSPSAYIGSRIAEPKSAIRKGLQKITTDMFHRTLFNRWSILRQIDPLIEKDYETHYGRGSELASSLISGKPTDFWGAPLPGSSFRQLLDSIPGKGAILSKYLIANRAVALGTPAKASETKTTPGSILMSKKPKLTEEQTRHMRETGIAYEEAKTFVDQVKAEHPDVVNVADKYYTQWLDNMYRVLEQMGPQTQWMVNIWKKNNLEATRTEHGYWVPFQAEGYDFILPSAPLTGSARAKIDPLLSLESAVKALFNTGLKQRVLSSIIEAATSSPAPFTAGHLVREVTGQQRQGLVRELEQRMQTLFGDAAESNITKAGTVAFLMPEFAGRSGDSFRTYVLMDGKKPRFFEMDPKVIKALDNSLWEMTTNPYWKFLMNFPAAVVRPMVTTYSTAFQLRNSARDLATAWRFIETSGLGAGDAAKLLQYYMASVADQLTFRRGKTTEGWFALFNRLGVTHSTKYLTERELMRSAGTKPIRGLEMLNRSFNWMSDKLSFTENATRAAATRMMLETKFNIKDPNQPLKPFQAAEAIWFYKNVTTNFQKQGSVTRNINQWVPFFTARIAEFSRLPGDFKRNPGKMLALAGTSLAYGYMHAIAHKDTPWYQEMESKQKMQSITFEYTDSQGVNRVGFIPLDSWNALSWGIGQAIGNLAIQDPNLKPSLIELAKAYFLGVTPINHPVDFLGVVGKEIAQQAMNKDYYFNRTIVPPGMEFVPTQYQSHELTTQLAKFLGETFGWSPIRIDHAIRTVTPTVSKIAMFGDKELGYQKAAETRSTNFIYNALSRTGGVSAVLDRSKEMFNDALLKFRSNKGIETVEEEQIRKAIEKVNKNISFASTALYMRLEQSERDTIRKYIKTMLTLGINISKGKVPPIVPSSQFRQEAQRIQQQKTAQRKARRAAFEEED